jgi:hypothetical protein
MSKHRLTRRGARLPVALSAGAAAIVAAALAATTGSAQTPTPATSLHLVSKAQKGVGFFPKGRPRQGDRFGFGDRISGDDTGYDRGTCTVIGTKAGICTVQLKLSKGTLAAQGLVSFSQGSKNAPVAITGGTGAYDGARGTAFVTDTSSSSSSIDVELKP